jgi:hypothetical protein
LKWKTGDFPDYIAEFRRARDISRLPSRVQFPLKINRRKISPNLLKLLGLEPLPTQILKANRMEDPLIPEELKYAEECRFKDVMKLPALWS